jgi:hypothetical protein
MHHCSLHSIGRGVTHGGLEILFFDMHDMYRPSQNILKVREFKKCLTVRDFLQYLLSVKNKSRLVQFVPLKEMLNGMIFCGFVR